MQLIPFLILIFFIDYAAFQAFLTVSQSWSPMAQTILYTLYWMVPVAVIGFMVAIVRGDISKWTKYNFSLVRSSFFLAYLAKFVMAFVLLLGGLGGLLFTGIEKIGGTEIWIGDHSVLLAQVAIMTGMIPFFMLLYGIIRNPYRYKFYREEVSIKNLPPTLKGLKIIQISDIHSGSFTKKAPIRNAIEMINSEQPDLVFFTGDLVNSIASEMDHFIDVFDKIDARYGVYSILGNHDYGDYVRWESIQAKKQNFEKLKETHRKMGWDLMMNENRLIEINGEKVAVIGVENYSAHPRFPKYGDLSEAYQGADGATLKLLLSHDPSHWTDEVLEKFKDIAITFSGHTHGFQFGIEIPGWIKWSPVKYVYKEWAGLYQKGSQFLYVNRGFGVLGYPGRLGILPEITVIELTK